MLKGFTVIALLAALATPVWAGAGSGAQSADGAADPAADASAIHLDWAALPNADDLANVYPAEARDRGVSGDTRIQCTVEPDGTLVDCEVLEEKPAGMGFAAAAVAASRRFRMKPYSPALVRGELPRVIIPVHWQIASEPDRAAPPPPAKSQAAAAKTAPQTAPQTAPEPFPGFFAVFPVFFLVLWLVVTSVLGLLSGWYGLMERYPDRREPALATAGSQSGLMGIGVSLRGVLTLAACESGLRVSMWRIFGPFSRPFLVPWRDVSARPVTWFFNPMARLSFGNPEVGVLSIDARVWERLAGAARRTVGSRVAPPDHVSEGRLAWSALAQWGATTAFGAAFFYFAPRLLSPQAPPLPLAVCIGLPAFGSGVGQLFRYLSRPR